MSGITRAEPLTNPAGGPGDEGEEPEERRRRNGGGGREGEEEEEEGSLPTFRLEAVLSVFQAHLSAYPRPRRSLRSARTSASGIEAFPTVFAAALKLRRPALEVEEEEEGKQRRRGRGRGGRGRDEAIGNNSFRLRFFFDARPVNQARPRQSLEKSGGGAAGSVVRRRSRQKQTRGSAEGRTPGLLIKVP